MIRKISEAEHKLSALYALDLLGAVTGHQLLEFCVDLELMDYVTMQLALGDLKSASQIEAVAHPLGALYLLTDKGRETLNLFIKRIPQSKQNQLQSGADKWKRRFAMQKQYLADHHPLENDDCILEMKIQQGDSWLLFMLIKVPKADAQGMLAQFPHVADKLYSLIFDELSEAYVPAGHSAEAWPECVSRVTGMPNVVRFSSDNELTVALPLPDDDMIYHFAHRWLTCHDALRHKIISIIARE